MDSEQLDLFNESSTKHRYPIQLGHAEVTGSNTQSILTKTTGFMSDYDYSLNPYSGCTYGCSYCYAAFFVRDEQQRISWGNWVVVKQNALTALRKVRTNLQDKTVYMSSVTDPYQPIERRLELVRSLLTELHFRGVRLVIQTRSPLVVRDIDLLKEFKHVRVNMTIGTDSRVVHKLFEPHCPSTRLRLRAIQRIHEAGIRSCITLTPLLPVENPSKFIQDLRATGVQHFVVQPFHLNRGKFIAGTRSEALQLAKEMQWDERSYEHFVRIMRSELPGVEEGRDGFAPE